MNKIQKVITLAATFVLMLGLSACDIEEAAPGHSGNYGTFDEFVYHHSEGFSMNCIKQDRGVTCDWAGKWKTNK